MQHPLIRLAVESWAYDPAFVTDAFADFRRQAGGGPGADDAAASAFLDFLLARTPAEAADFDVAEEGLFDGESGSGGDSGDGSEEESGSGSASTSDDDSGGGAPAAATRGRRPTATPARGRRAALAAAARTPAAAARRWSDEDDDSDGGGGGQRRAAVGRKRRRLDSGSDSDDSGLFVNAGRGARPSTAGRVRPAAVSLAPPASTAWAGGGAMRVACPPHALCAFCSTH